MSEASAAGESQRVGMVLGTESATPLEWWVAIEPDQFLQLDDVVLVRTAVPGVGEVRISGVVDMVRAQHEGAASRATSSSSSRACCRCRSRAAGGSSPRGWSRRSGCRRSPGIGSSACAAADRDEALHFDAMEQPLAAGLSRDGQPIYLDLSFLDGRRGAHVNISGVSGVATKTTYASFVLYSLFHSGVLGGEAANTKALIFNVKGEDLLFLDRPNAGLDHEAAGALRPARAPAGPFESVGIWAPVRRGSMSRRPTPAAARTASAPTSGRCAMS